MIDEKGYGAIYGSTWWGTDSGLLNSIYWGDIYWYIQAVAALKDRAYEDGGYTEGFECAVTDLRVFPEADLGRQLFDAYDARCEAASGDTEARVCTINELNDLL
jgi:hypothetical protein